MSDFPKTTTPELFDPTGAAVPPGTPRVERSYLEIPQDEVPDPYLRDRPAREAEHIVAPEVKISVVFDQRPLLEAVNEAVNANDIKRVMAIFQHGRFEVTQGGPKLVRVRMIP